MPQSTSFYKTSSLLPPDVRNIPYVEVGGYVRKDEGANWFGRGPYEYFLDMRFANQSDS